MSQPKNFSSKIPGKDGGTSLLDVLLTKYNEISRFITPLKNPLNLKQID